MSEGGLHHHYQGVVKRRKWIHAALLLTSFFGFLKWGGQQSAFFFEIEWKVISNLFEKPLDLLHPAIGMPLTGQLALFISLFQKEPGKALSWIGFGLLTPIFVMALIIGILGSEAEMLLAVLPYWVFANFFLRSWLMAKSRPAHHGPKSDLL